MPPPTVKKGAILPFYPSEVAEAMIVVYDLRDPDTWERAHRERRAWGGEYSEIHALDNDHVVIEFRPGGALEASA